ncbi:MAG: TlpA family protein disulfide reductase [Pelomonas sp.]|nr:TlpA family protein disulfide reductase [Roseateles sp.]
MNTRRPSKPALIAAVVGAALAVGAWVALAPAGEAAPAVHYVLLDGKPADSSQWHGKVMFVSFWATDCTTCVHEMPQVVQTFQKYKGRGFDTLAVAMSYDPPAYVSNFAASRALPFGVAIDNMGTLAKAFGQVRMTPTSFLIDKNGRIVKRFVGEPDFGALQAQIEQLLAA